MISMLGKDLARILERHGWELRRIQGSHHIYCKPGNKARISIPIHGNASLKSGLLSHLLKTAGLSKDDL